MVHHPSRRHRNRVHAGPSAGWRCALLFALVPLWLLTAAGIAARWWDTASVAPLLQALFPVFGAATVLILLLSLLTRAGWAVLASAALVVPPAIVAFPALQSDTVTGSSDDEVVMTLNVEYGRADPAEVVALVKEKEVDTLVLVEITPQGWSRLRQEGLRRLLPNTVGEPQAGAGGSMIISTHPLEQVDGDEFDELHESFSQPIAAVDRPTGDYLLRAVHPYPPVPSMASFWREQLDHLGRWQAAQSPERPLIMAGDFNASRSHPGFRRATEGLVDAQEASGAGWARTWPEGKAVPPFVAIDHILVRSVDVVDAGDAKVSETDHRAVWARLRMG